MDEEIRWVLKMLSEHRISVLSADRMLRALQFLQKSEANRPVVSPSAIPVPEKQEALLVTPQRSDPVQEKLSPPGNVETVEKIPSVSRIYDRPKGRIVSLLLSFICCGLGQVYRGRILKGAGFITIYVSLIVSIFFLSSAPLLYYFGFPILLLMWIMGMVDAYTDDGMPMEGGRNLALRRLPAALSVVVVSGALIIIGMMMSQTYSPADERLAPDAQNVKASAKMERVEIRTGARETNKADEDTVTTVYTPVPAMDSEYKGEGDEEITVIALKLGSENGYTDHYSQDITIAANRLEPAVVKPGTTLRVGYTIGSPGPADLVLGFSIQKVGTGRWISDPGNDRMISVEPGGGEYSREFVLPDSLDPGKYNVAWGIWDLGYSHVYDSRKSTSALTVVVPSEDGPAVNPPSGDGTGNPESVSIQAASLGDVVSAEKLYYRLLSEGYPARMEYSASAEGERHNVLVGEFRSEKEAALLAEDLHRREGLSPTIVRRHADNEKNDE